MLRGTIFEQENFVGFKANFKRGWNLVPALLAVAIAILAYQNFSQQDDLSRIQSQNADLQAQIDTKAPYPVALAERVLALESKNSTLASQAAKVDTLAVDSRIKDLDRRVLNLADSQMYYAKQMYDVRDDSISGVTLMLTAATLYDSGQISAGKAVAAVGVSQILGSFNFSCHSPRTTDPVFLGLIPEAKIRSLLDGSNFHIVEVVPQSGYSMYKLQADPFTGGC